MSDLNIKHDDLSKSTDTENSFSKDTERSGYIKSTGEMNSNAEAVISGIKTKEAKKSIGGNADKAAKEVLEEAAERNDEAAKNATFKGKKGSDSFKKAQATAAIATRVAKRNIDLIKSSYTESQKTSEEQFGDMSKKASEELARDAKDVYKLFHKKTNEKFSEKNSDLNKGTQNKERIKNNDDDNRLQTKERDLRKKNKSGTGSAKKAEEAGVKSKKPGAVASGAKEAGAKTAKEGSYQLVKESLKSIAASIKWYFLAAIAILLVIVFIVIAVCIISSPASIAHSNEEGKLTEVINTVIDEYRAEIKRIKEENSPYDTFEISGTPPAWKEILSIFIAEKCYEKDEEKQVVFSAPDGSWEEPLSDIFWKMTSLSTNITTVTTTDVDEKGNKTFHQQKHITVEVLASSAMEYADNNDFSEEQKRIVETLLGPDYTEMWDDLLKDVSYSLYNGSGAAFLGEFPYYNQGDYSYPYGDDTIAGSGCGPTCFAMVATYLCGYEIDPVTVCKWAGNRYYVANVGTSWSFFSDAADHWDFDMEYETTSIESAYQALQEGKVVISSQSAGTFTSGGHFIVLRGLSKNGKILVSDPNNGANRNGGLDREWEKWEISASGTHYWIFNSDLLSGSNVENYIWNYFTSRGWSDACTAGLIGHMYSECGLQWNLYGYDGISAQSYGLMMWVVEYVPEIQGASLQKQCQFIYEDYIYRINVMADNYYAPWGYGYYGYNTDKFFAETRPENVATAIACCIGRGNVAMGFIDTLPKREAQAREVYNRHHR